jgi:predicted PurR-regulated permease PerM
MKEINNPRWLAVLVITAIALYLCWRMLEPFLSVLLWATVLVIIFYPLYERLVEKTRRPSISAILSILLIMIAVIMPVVLISLAVANELSQLVNNLQAAGQKLMSNPVQSERIHKLLSLLQPYVNIENLKDPISKISQTALKGTINVVGGVLGAVVKVFFILFAMYYLFRDGEKIALKLPDQIPLEHDRAVRILNHTREIISASVYGVLVIAIIQGTLGGLMFWFLGIPSALVWGVLMTLLSTIPMAGAFIVWVPAAIILALSGHWTQAIIMTLWGSLVIGSIDNFMRPKLVGQKARMHELVIFFSVLGGLSVFGVLGILLGPVIVAITIALLEVLGETSEPISGA